MPKSEVTNSRTRYESWATATRIGRRSAWLPTSTTGCRQSRTSSHRSAGSSLLQVLNLLSEKHVLVVQRTVRTPQSGYRAGHPSHRELAGSTSLAEPTEFFLQERDAPVDCGRPVMSPSIILPRPPPRPRRGALGQCHGSRIASRDGQREGVGAIHGSIESAWGPPLRVVSTLRSYSFQNDRRAQPDGRV